MIRLIAPPLPAASRPSKITRTRLPLDAHPLLELDQLGLQAQELALVRLAGQLGGPVVQLLDVLVLAHPGEATPVDGTAVPGPVQPAGARRGADVDLPGVQRQVRVGVALDDPGVAEHRVDVAGRRVVVEERAAQVGPAAAGAQVVGRAEDRVVRVVDVAAEAVARPGRRPGTASGPARPRCSCSAAGRSRSRPGSPRPAPARGWRSGAGPRRRTPAARRPAAPASAWAGGGSGACRRPAPGAPGRRRRCRGPRPAAAGAAAAGCSSRGRRWPAARR